MNGTGEEQAMRSPSRLSPRDSVLLSTSISVLPGGPPIAARVRNLSSTGMMAECSGRLRAGDRVAFELRGIGALSGQVVWARGARIGVHFDRPVDPQRTRKGAAPAASDTDKPVYIQMIDENSGGGHYRPALRRR